MIASLCPNQSSSCTCKILIAFASVHQERALDEALMCVESFSSPQSDTYTLALAAYAHSLADVSSDARARVMDLMNSKAVVQGGCTSVGQDHLAKVGVLYSYSA